MRFAIFTHVLHSKQAGEYSAYAPYVREMNIWLRHVDEVEVVGTRRRGDEGTGGRGDLEIRGLGENGIRYEHSNLTFTEVPSFNFLNFSSAVKAITKIPVILFKITGAMSRADHLHLRCPGNVGLLACICQIFFPSKPKSAKYAGNWDPEAKQPWTYKFQRWILSNTFLTKNMQVLAYGDWPGQTKNIKSFFTASFSEKEIPAVKEKDFTGPLTFLFVGNLVPGKNPLLAIQLVQAISKNINDRQINLEVYGDGPERQKLENYVSEQVLEDLVYFKGSRSLEELKQAYQEAHFVILPSQSEGWPKAIAEGMFFGCIPIATAVSCVPWMLEAPPAPASPAGGPEGGAPKVTVTGRGILIPTTTGGGNKKTDWIEETSHDIQKLIKDPEEMKRMSMAAMGWSQQYTLEKFEEAIKNVLKV